MVQPNAPGFAQESKRSADLYSGSRSRPQICSRFKKLLRACGLRGQGPDWNALRPLNRAEHDRHSNDARSLVQTWIHARPLDAGTSHGIPYFDSIRGLAPTGYEHPSEYRTGADLRLVRAVKELARASKLLYRHPLKTHIT